MHGLMMDTPLLITDIMRFALAEPRGSRGRFRHGGRTRGTAARTGEVFRRAAQLANALRAAGIRAGRPGRHARLERSPASRALFRGLVHGRRAAHDQPAAVSRAGASSSSMTRRTACSSSTRRCCPCSARCRASCRPSNAVIALTSDEALPPAAARPHAELTKPSSPRSPATFDWPELDERTASGLCYTSGTTGNPKGVLYSHRSTVLHAYAGCMPDVLGLSGRDSVLAVVPMFHANAWGLPYNAPMTGATSRVRRGRRWRIPRRLTDLIESEGVTMAAGVPTVWTGLLAYLEQTGRKLPTLKRTLVGGSAVPLQDDPRVRREARRHRAARLGHDRDEPARHG